MKLVLRPVGEPALDLRARLDFASERFRFETSSRPGSEWSCRFRLRSAEFVCNLTNLESPREQRAYQNPLPTKIGTEISQTNALQQSRDEKSSLQAALGVKNGALEASSGVALESNIADQCDRSESVSYTAEHFTVHQKGPVDAPCWEINAAPLPVLQGHLEQDFARLIVLRSPFRVLARLNVARSDVVIADADLVAPEGVVMSANQLCVILHAIRVHVSDRPLCEQEVLGRAD